jgi:hypothetical protein
MPSRTEAFEALRDADEKAREASRLFHREMETALNSGTVPPEPWDLAVRFYQNMREAQKERDRAWYAYGCVMGVSRDA